MTMSYSLYGSSHGEGWEDLIDWTGEYYDPIFQGKGSFVADQQHTLAPSLFSEGAPSIEYTISSPPSFRERLSSFGQNHDISSSFDTTATSLLADENNEQYFGSFGASYQMLQSPCPVIEPPILDTRYARITDSFPSPNQSFETAKESVFNPHIVGSSQSFSDLDVRVSQAFSNFGTWADQPQIIEPIAESDHQQVDSWPDQNNQAHSSFLLYTEAPISDATDEQHNQSRAIPISETSQRPAGYNNSVFYSRRPQRLTPTLSISPVAHRTARSCTLSRSTTPSRRKLATPSPTESYEWVSYRPNPLTNKLAPSSTDGVHSRMPRGRKKGLTAEGRRHAALMRIVGACTNCQRGKRKCDSGTPCKPCLEHYRGDLVHQPCRDRLLANLADTFLSDRLGWHPTARSPGSFGAPDGVEISQDITYTIPVIFGFGLPFTVPVHALRFKDKRPLVHTHVIYPWPPEQSSSTSHRHAVLPAVLSTDVSIDLQPALNTHLSMLVTHCFREFPLYLSPLRILKNIYIFYRTLPPTTPHAVALHQALKLLVLVHIGGDITLLTDPSQSDLTQLLHATMSPLPNPTSTPAPCFLRAQFGAIMPSLASTLMKNVLASLEQLLLNRDCEDWPVALALLLLLLMTVESIQYHAAKLPYHHHLDNPDHTNHLDNHNHSAQPNRPNPPTSTDDEAVSTLLTFYAACYAGCHARLRPDWEGEPHTLRPHQRASPEDTFVQRVRTASQRARAEGYLARKAGADDGDGDGDGRGMEYFFDRLVARALVG